MQQSGDSCQPNTSPDLKAKCSQLLRHDICSANFAIAEFGMLVEVTPPFDHFRIDRSHGRIDLLASDIGPGTASD
jgi:hypothetical protein